MILWHGQDYDNVEDFLEDHPFYPPEMSENQACLEELELEKREELRGAGALDWEYRFFACSALYTALVDEWLKDKDQRREWQARKRAQPPGKEIHWATWKGLFTFLIRADTGPMLSALLERNNLVEPHWKEMRKGFLDELLSWDRCSANRREALFYGRIGNNEIGREGVTRAFQLLRLDRDAIARHVDRSFAEKRFAPLCDLLVGANPPWLPPLALGEGDVAPAINYDDSRSGGSPLGKPYSILNYVKDLTLSKQTRNDLFDSVLSGLTDFEPINILLSFCFHLTRRPETCLVSLFLIFLLTW